MLLETIFKNQKIYSSVPSSGLFFKIIFNLSLILVSGLPLFYGIQQNSSYKEDFLGSVLFFVLLGSIIVVIFGIAFLIIKGLLFHFYIKKLIGKRSYVETLELDTRSQLKQSVIFYELEEKEFPKIRVMRAGDNWQLYDTTFHVISRKRRGKRKRSESYYSVFEARFDRLTPHVVFDSLLAKKKQFKHLYLKSQKTSLGAGFDEHFESYVPQHYDIDALSFITPEIMTRMAALKEYDIEFVRGNMLCYAPLLREEQLAPFLEKCLDLHAATNRNLSHYKDSWLKQDRGVTEFGRQLLQNPTRFLWITLSCAVTVVYLTIFTRLFLSSAIYWMLAGSGAVSFVKYMNVKRVNKKKEADFRKSLVGNSEPETDKSLQ